jgi:hypothetical protein
LDDFGEGFCWFCHTVSLGFGRKWIKDDATDIIRAVVWRSTSPISQPARLIALEVQVLLMVRIECKDACD